MKIAVIGPSFFGYAKAIVSNLNARENYHADYFDERPSNSILVKLLIRLRLKYLLGSYYKGYIERTLSVINQGSYDVLLSLDAEGLNNVWLENVKVKKKVFYMWDSVKNKPIFSSLFPSFDLVATFDPLDAENLQIPLVHLFAEDEFSYILHSTNKSRLLSFIGTIHSIRRKILNNVPIKYSVDGHFYYYSKLLYRMKCIGEGSLRNKDRFSVSSNILSKEQVGVILRESISCLDITHPDQSGLTSRTFEALRANCYLFSNNVDNILNHVPANLHSRVKDVKLLLKGETGQLDELEVLPASSDYWLSLDRFCDEILTLCDVE